MAKQSKAEEKQGATLAERRARPVLDRGMLGPYGDKDLYGTHLMQDDANATPQESNDLEQPTKWKYQGYVPGTVKELESLLKRKPDMLLEMVQERLMTKYRAQSWAEIRGGNVTADVRFTLNGKTIEKRVPLEVLAAMREAGMTVEVMARIAKEKKSK